MSKAYSLGTVFEVLGNNTWESVITNIVKHPKRVTPRDIEKLIAVASEGLDFEVRTSAYEALETAFRMNPTFVTGKGVLRILDNAEREKDGDVKMAALRAFYTALEKNPGVFQSDDFILPYVSLKLLNIIATPEPRKDFSCYEADFRLKALQAHTALFDAFPITATPFAAGCLMDAALKNPPLRLPILNTFIYHGFRNNPRLAEAEGLANKLLKIHSSPKDKIGITSLATLQTLDAAIDANPTLATLALMKKLTAYYNAEHSEDAREHVLSIQSKLRCILPRPKFLRRSRARVARGPNPING